MITTAGLPCDKHRLRDMRKPIIAGNWKMNTSISEGVALSRAVAAKVGHVASVEVVVCPPFVSLQLVVAAVRETNLKVGAQNVSEHDAGAFTGEVSVGMVSDLVDYAIVGHSERRSNFGESDAQVALKVRASIAGGLTPILCVGESEETRDAGNAEQFVRGQVSECLREHHAGQPLVIAYEPIWAIGTGQAATLPQIEYMVESIREELADTFDPTVGEATPILYGGSVNPANIEEYAASDCIDGALVGGASLNADDFVAIVNAQAAAVSQP